MPPQYIIQQAFKLSLPSLLNMRLWQVLVRRYNISWLKDQEVLLSISLYTDQLQTSVIDPS
jgi:hypothetical protein